MNMDNINRRGIEKFVEKDEVFGWAYWRLKYMRVMAAINCMSRRYRGEISNRSEKSPNKETLTAGTQNQCEIPVKNEENKKAVRSPIPPPFGVGILCELREFGLSKSESFIPHFAIIHAPAPPKNIDIR
jgi:hypothetical protein